MPDTLSTDHVNYIVCRYLQEHGYKRSAVQLMREWRQGDERELPFESAVDRGELVSLILHGLRIDEAAVTHGNETRRFKFLHQGPKREGHHREESSGQLTGNDNIDSPRKRQKLDTSATSSRNSRGKKHAANGNEADADGTLVDDHDPAQQGANEHEREPEIEPPQPPPTTKEIGSDAHMQTEEPLKPPVAKTLFTEKIAGADILHVAFHPTDANILETAGGSVLRRIKMVSDPDQLKEGDEIEVELSNMSSDQDRPYYITAYSRAAHGDQTALAVEHGNHRTISFGKGVFPHVGPAHKIVLSLQWDKTSRVALATMGSKDEAGSALLWDNRSSDVVAELCLEKPALGATWLSAGNFALVGEAFIDVYRFSIDQQASEEGAAPVALEKSIKTDLPWYTIRYDPSSSRIACGTATDNGLLGVLEVDTDKDSLEVIDAHEGPVTGLQWQPCTGASAVANGDASGANRSPSIPLLASSSVDGTIKLWDVSEKPRCVHEFAADNNKAIVAVAFSPDGKHLAGASEDRSLAIWEAKGDGKVVAIWSPEIARDEAKGKPGVSVESPADRVARLNGSTGKVSDGTTNGNGIKQDTEMLDAPAESSTDRPVNTNGKFSPTIDDKPRHEEGQEPDADDEESEESHSLSWNVTCDRLAYGCGDTLSIIYLPQCRNEAYRKSPPIQTDEPLPNESQPPQDGQESDTAAAAIDPDTKTVKREDVSIELQPAAASDNKIITTGSESLPAQTVSQDATMGNTD